MVVVPVLGCVVPGRVVCVPAGLVPLCGVVVVVAGEVVVDGVVVEGVVVVGAPAGEVVLVGAPAVVPAGVPAASPVAAGVVAGAAGKVGDGSGLEAAPGTSVSMV